MKSENGYQLVRTSISHVREVLSLHIGQAGVQIGVSSWVLYCLEHNIDRDGVPSNDECPSPFQNDGFQSFFQELPSGNYAPRAVMIDLEPTVVDEVRTGPFKQLYAPSQMLSGQEDAANNYARGHYTVGKEMSELAMECIRKMADDCDRLQGFLLFHSLGGGTGSGLHALLMDKLGVYFAKKSRLEFAIYPSPQLSTAVVEPYNAVLTTHDTLWSTDCAFLADNRALFNVCKNKLDIDRPTYSDLNRLLAQAVSSITSGQRFEGVLNADFIDFQTDLVPYPRVHFPLVSYAPIASAQRAHHRSATVGQITNACFEPSNRFLECESRRGLYMACCLVYRGDVTPKEVNRAVAAVKGRDSVQFAGFKVGIGERPPGAPPGGNVRRTLCTLTNTTAVREAWRRLNRNFSRMWAKRAFVHWYLAEGMEEEEFSDALENTTALERDYSEVELNFGDPEM